MPEENINYTISCINGNLWAKVDGTYPVYKLDIECNDQLFWTNDKSFTFTGDTLPIVYPTPPGTTNISLKMDSTEINWSNYTQIYPDATHYTALGNWSMIYSTIHPVVNNFTFKIHYEHPIDHVNGTNRFLYDLNISPYLSPWSNKSVAYFNIMFETNYTNLQVNTIGINGTLNPVNYTIIKKGETEVVSLQVISIYNKPLLGDLLISFTHEKELKPTNFPFSGFELWAEQGYALVLITLIVVVSIGVVAVIVFYKSKIRKQKHNIKY